MIASKTYRANVRRCAHAGLAWSIEILVLAEAKVCDLEHRCGLLARLGLLQLYESVF